MSHFVVTETIDRDLGLLGVVRYRKQHGQGCLQLAAIVGGHFGQRSHFVVTDRMKQDFGLSSERIWGVFGLLEVIFMRITRMGSI